MRLRERVADLAQQVDRALRGQRPEPLHQRLQVEPVQQLHHVVEGAVFGDPEVVQLDGMGGPHERRCLGFALEPPQGLLSLLVADGPEHIGPHQLDRGRPRQHAVLGAPHLTHAALTEPLDQPIAPHLAGLPHRCTQLVHDAGADVSRHYDQPVRHDDHVDPPSGFQLDGRTAVAHGEQQRQGHRSGREDRRPERLPGRVRNHDRVEHDPGGDERQPEDRQMPRLILEPAVHAPVGCERDAVGGHDLERHADVHDRLKGEPLAAGQHGDGEGNGYRDRSRTPLVEVPVLLAELGVEQYDGTLTHQETGSEDHCDHAEPLRGVPQQILRQARWRPGDGPAGRGRPLHARHQRGLVDHLAVIPRSCRHSNSGPGLRSRTTTPV